VDYYLSPWSSVVMNDSCRGADGIYTAINTNSIVFMAASDFKDRYVSTHYLFYLKEGVYR